MTLKNTRKALTTRTGDLYPAPSFLWSLTTEAQQTVGIYRVCPHVGDGHHHFVLTVNYVPVAQSESVANDDLPKSKSVCETFIARAKAEWGPPLVAAER